MAGKKSVPGKKAAALAADLSVELPRRYVPQPHIIDGINYRVIDSPRAYMGREPGKAVLASPQTPADVGRILALHEEGHAKWTPDINPGEAVAKLVAASEGSVADALAAIADRPEAAAIVNVCEDTRVNARLRVHLGIGADQWAPVEAHYERLGHGRALKHIREHCVESKRSKDALGMLLGLLPLRSKPSWDAGRSPVQFTTRYMPDMPSAERAWVEQAVRAQARLEYTDTSFDTTLDAARSILHAATQLETLWGKAEREAEAAEFGDTAVADERLESDAREKIALRPGKETAKSGRPSIDWVPMTIENPDRPERIPTPRFRSRMRATDTGSVLRYPARFCVDSAVFAMRRHIPGGSLLIDVSGSMGIDAADIDAIVAAAPLAVVAIYSGDTADGVLRIVAKDGRRLAAGDIRRGMDGGNCCDGPALEWLAKQQEPRVWVCDGAVTGRGDRSHPALTVEAFAIAKAGRIVRIPTAAEAVAAFQNPRKLVEYIRARFRADNP